MKKVLPILIALMFMATPAYAYEITGTLNTGVSPATPTGLTSSKSNSSDTSISIHWNSVASISGYHLYRITGVSTTPSVLIASTTSTSYTDTELSDGKYSYQIESYLGNLVSAKSVPTFPVTIDTTVSNDPSSPGNTTPSSGGGGGGGGSYTPVNTTSLAGDINHDRKVDILDFNALLVHWGQKGSNIDADLNGNDVVGILDFNILIVNWQT